MKDREKTRKPYLRIILIVGFAVAILLALFVMVELKMPHNHLFTSDIERHFFKRYGDECTFSFGEKDENNLIQVSVSGCDYEDTVAYYNTEDGTDDWVSALAPKIFKNYASEISEATNGATDSFIDAQYLDLEKMEWGYIPTVSDVLSSVYYLSLDLHEINEDKAIVRKLDELARNNFLLRVDTFDGSTSYSLTIRIEFKDKIIQIAPDINKVRSRAVDAPEDDEGQEYEYSVYFKWGWLMDEDAEKALETLEESQDENDSEDLLACGEWRLSYFNRAAFAVDFNDVAVVYFLG